MICPTRSHYRAFIDHVSVHHPELDLALSNPNKPTYGFFCTRTQLAFKLWFAGVSHGRVEYLTQLIKDPTRAPAS